MGQAKLRGSYAERKASAIQLAHLKAVADSLERDKREAERKQWDIDHPAQTRKRNLNTVLIASALSMAIPTLAYEFKD